MEKAVHLLSPTFSPQSVPCCVDRPLPVVTEDFLPLYLPNTKTFGSFGINLHSLRWEEQDGSSLA